MAAFVQNVSDLFVIDFFRTLNFISKLYTDEALLIGSKR